MMSEVLDANKIVVIDVDALHDSMIAKLTDARFTVLRAPQGQRVELLDHPAWAHPETDALLRSLRELVRQDHVMDPQVALVQLCNILLGEPGASCAVTPPSTP